MIVVGVVVVVVLVVLVGGGGAHADRGTSSIGRDFSAKPKYLGYLGYYNNCRAN